MAINLDVQYPGRTVVDGANPRGTFKDSTFPGAFDGTPAQFAWARDMWALLEKIMDVGGLVASGTPDTAAVSQRYDALVIAARNIWPIWDAANIYVKGAIIIGSDDLTYQSLQGGNLNHDPLLGDPWWTIFPATATNLVQGITFLNKQRIVSSNNVIDAVNDIDFSGGKFIFDDGSGEKIAIPLTKQLDINFAIGNNAGGLDTGSIGDNTYHCFAIFNPTTEVTDFLFSLSPTVPTLPAGFTKKQRVWSIVRISGSILGFNQNGKKCSLKIRQEDLLNPFVGTAPQQILAHTLTLSTPTGIETQATLNIKMADNAGNNLIMTALDEADVAPIDANSDISIPSDNGFANGEVIVKTNTLSQIRGRIEVANYTVMLGTLKSWEDFTLEV